jgi:hypothetical protein
MTMPRPQKKGVKKIVSEGVKRKTHILKLGFVPSQKPALQLGYVLSMHLVFLSRTRQFLGFFLKP